MVMYLTDVLYVKSLITLMDGWVGGCIKGWVGGRVDGRMYNQAHKQEDVSRVPV
jgi:hypothetical protein